MSSSFFCWYLRFCSSVCLPKLRIEKCASNWSLKWHRREHCVLPGSCFCVFVWRALISLNVCPLTDTISPCMDRQTYRHKHCWTSGVSLVETVAPASVRLFRKSSLVVLAARALQMCKRDAAADSTIYDYRHLVLGYTVG